jgi:hypothetical protein
MAAKADMFEYIPRTTNLTLFDPDGASKPSIERNSVEF